MTLAARLAWLSARLRNMSGAEVAHRLREQFRKRTTRWMGQGWQRHARHADGPCPVLPGLRQTVLAADPALRTHVAEAASAFLGGRFEALGVTWPADAVRMDFPAALWTLDPVSGRAWPGAGHDCFAISYRFGGATGDVKHVWEFGRLQFLPLLAADHLLHGRPASLAAVEAALTSWHRHNPPYQGVHWAELLNVAIRAISVLATLSLVGDRLQPATVAAARSLLAAHAWLLARFPSRHSSANNHLVAELAAEYLIHEAMPDLPGAARQRAHALGELQDEAFKQILDDGVPAEQSPSYGGFTVEFLLLTCRVASAAGRAPAPALLDRLCLYADHVQALANERGLVPALCDNDEGRVLTSCCQEADYPLAMAAAVCAVAGRPLQAGRMPAPRLRDLVFGRAQAGAALPAQQRVCRSGGYSIDRRDIAGRRCILGFDHGPLGYLSIAAHGHADALSLVLDIDGEGVLVDPGTYLYHGGGAWRDWFRSTAAHNTLVLDGANQSRMAGPFNWLSKARCELLESVPGPAWRWRARHDGYARTTGCLHERCIEATDDGYLVTDRLAGGQDRVADVVFQLGEGLEAVMVERHCSIRRDGVALLELAFEAPGQLCQFRGAAPSEGGGWVSPRFGVRVPATRLVWSGRVPVAGARVRIRVPGAPATAELS